MPAPLPPTSLSVTASSGQAFLLWNRAAGARTYNVQRGTSSGGPYTVVGSVPATTKRITPQVTTASFIDSGLTDGTIYYYVVTSVESGVESALSSQVSVTPGAIPSPPASLSLTPGDTQIAVSWTASTGATSYNLWRSTTHGGGYTLLVSQAGTTYTNTGLTNGTPYYYTVSAIGASGEGAMTDEATATPSAGVASMTTASRTTGVAPLGVFFDAVDEVTPFAWTSGVAQPAAANFAIYSYQWDFGDPASGNWSTDSRSANNAIGYCAAHVYETAGSYTVTLTITKDDETSVTYTQAITVSAFSGTNYYISATGSDSNDGLTTVTPWQTYAKVAANIGTNRAFHFKRGDTFPVSIDGCNVNAAGPGMFSDYGSGALPIIQSTDVTHGAALFNVVANDWRFWNLNLIGPGASDQVGAIWLDPSAKRSNTTIYKVSASLWRVPFGSTEVSGTFNTPSTEAMIIAGCTIANPQVNGIFFGGLHNAAIGNSVTNCATSHLIRCWLGHKFAASNNYLSGAGATRHDLKIHAPSGHASHPETQYAHVSYNQHRNSQVWPMSIGPEDSGADEFVHDVVVDSCDLISPAGEVVQTFIHNIGTPNFTCRNCWTNATLDKYFSIVVLEVSANGAVPVPTNIRIYGNTLYKSDSQSGNDIAIVSIGSTSVGTVIVQNNLMSAPNVPSAAINSGTCAGFSQDHNLITNSPGFQNAASNNFHLTAGSPATNAGTQLDYLRRDYDNVARPLAAAPDLGAYEL